MRKPQARPWAAILPSVKPAASKPVPAAKPYARSLEYEVSAFM
jgi:hypothetical protein